MSALEAVDGPDEEIRHPLVLGDQVFACKDELPVSTLIRYANNDLLAINKILDKMIEDEDRERMWDAFETLSADEVTEAVGALVATYSARPTRRPTPSRAGSKHTKRK